jgi:hypothetical protein
MDPTMVVQALGLLLIGAGVALLSVPAALIVVGALLLLLATLAEMISMHKDNDDGATE